MARSKIIGPATGEQCSYGCQLVAIVKFANGKSCCSNSHGLCSAIRKKNSEGLKQAYLDGRKDCGHFVGKRGWSKGLTAETSKSIRLLSEKRKLESKTKIHTSEKHKRSAYKYACSWDAKNIQQHMPRIPGYYLLQEYGMYDKKSNVAGVVRDHRLSVADGYKQNISPEIMKHPANCRFLTQKDNAKKTHKSELTLQQLMNLIAEW